MKLTFDHVILSLCKMVHVIDLKWPSIQYLAWDEVNTNKMEVWITLLGEDRWLCTLLLKQGWRVEYSAASDAFTFAPEGFDEFYKQVCTPVLKIMCHYDIFRT